MLLYRLKRYINLTINTTKQNEPNTLHEYKNKYINNVIVVQYMVKKEYINEIFSKIDRVTFIWKVGAKQLYEGIEYEKNSNNKLECTYSDTLFVFIKTQLHGGDEFYFTSFKYYNAYDMKGQWKKIIGLYKNPNLFANIGLDKYLNHYVTFENGYYIMMDMKKCNFVAEVCNNKDLITHKFNNGYYIMMDMGHCVLHVKCPDICKYIDDIDKCILRFLGEIWNSRALLEECYYKVRNIGKPFTIQTLQKIELSNTSYITHLWIEREKKEYWRKLYRKSLAAMSVRDRRRKSL